MKSSLQKIIEAIAIVVVLGVMAFVGVAIYGQVSKNSKEARLKAEAENLASIRKSSTSPQISNTPPKPFIPPLPKSPLATLNDEDRKQFRLRFLPGVGLPGTNNVMSRDGRLAVLLGSDSKKQSQSELQLWDLDRGILVCPLPTSKDEVKPKQNPVFATMLDRVAFSKDKTYVAGLTIGHNFSDSILTWKTNSGELLQVYDDSDHSGLFTFVDDHRLLAATTRQLQEGGMEQLDVESGNVSLVIPLEVSNYFSAGAIDDHAGIVASNRGVFSISLETNRRTNFTSPEGLNPGFAQFLWLSNDKSLVYAANHALVRAWNIASGEYATDFPIRKSREPVQVKGIAADAGLLVMESPIVQNHLEIYRISDKSELALVIQSEHEVFQQVAISADGKRILLRSDQPGMIMIDVPDPLPSGTLRLPPKGELPGDPRKTSK